MVNWGKRDDLDTIEGTSDQSSDQNPRDTNRMWANEDFLSQKVEGVFSVLDPMHEKKDS